MGNPDRASRGMTLVEVLVAAFLAAVAATMLFSIFVPLMKASAGTSQRATLQQLGGLAVAQILEDSAGVPPVGVTPAVVLPSGEAFFALHSVNDFTVDGRSLYASQIVVYRWEPAGKVLSRALWPAQPDPAVIPPSGPLQADLAQMEQAFQDGSVRVISRDVVEFRFDSGTGSGVELPLQLFLALEVEDVRLNKVVRLEYGRSIYLNNRL